MQQLRDGQVDDMIQTKHLGRFDIMIA
jgi:hypothetical protein